MRFLAQRCPPFEVPFCSGFVLRSGERNVAPACSSRHLGLAQLLRGYRTLHVPRSGSPRDVWNCHSPRLSTRQISLVHQLDKRQKARRWKRGVFLFQVIHSLNTRCSNHFVLRLFSHFLSPLSYILILSRFLFLVSFFQTVFRFKSLCKCMSLHEHDFELNTFHNYYYCF